MTKTTIGDHAIVLGASMAGLLTARVLADTYTRVTVVERDTLPADMSHRRGVPHGLHLHGLHAAGGQVLDELFPGFTEQVVAAGAEVGDTLGDACGGSCRVSGCVRSTSACPAWPSAGRSWRVRSGNESGRCRWWVSSRVTTCWVWSPTTSAAG